MKPNLSTLGSIIEISSNITGSQMVITPNDSIRGLMGFKPKVIHEEYILSDYQVIFHEVITFSSKPMSLKEWFLKGEDLE